MDGIMPSTALSKFFAQNGLDLSATRLEVVACRRGKGGGVDVKLGLSGERPWRSSPG